MKPNGKIIIQVFNVSVKIQNLFSVFVFQWEKIDRIIMEKLPEK
jgi:hypothetical protein